MRQFRRTAGTGRLCWSLAAAIACVSGCADSDPVQRRRLEGEVKIDGEPADLALITFIPIAPTAGPKASGLVRQGKYVIEQKDGPYPGRFLVKIENVPYEIEAMAARRTGTKPPPAPGKLRPVVAADYNRDSTITVTVRQDEENRFDFDVESAPTAHRPR